MNSYHYMAVGAITVATVVALFCVGYFLGEAHLASLVQAIRYAFDN